MPSELGKLSPNFGAHSKLSSVPHHILPWRPSQAQNPHVAHKHFSGGLPLSPEKIHSDVQVLFQNHSKLGLLQG